MAQRAYEFLLSSFWDQENQGVFFTLDHQGKVINANKKIYMQAFSIYALTEYYLATGNTDSLNKAIELFNLIEEKSYDAVNKSYYEDFSGDWTKDTSSSDPFQSKSMNTQMHVLEAYTNLYAAWKNDLLAEKLKELLFVIKEKIVNKETHHLFLSFDQDWHPENGDFYFGLDIKSSWLLSRAADVLENQDLVKEIHALSIRMAEAVLRDGQDKDGGLFYKGNGGSILDNDKYWWPQAEGLVGFMNAYQLSGENRFLTATKKLWSFLEEYIIDQKGHEWFSKVYDTEIARAEDLKASSGKCPYHNGRACLELIQRMENL